MKFNRKTIRRIYFKLVKQSGSPESIARGVAIGLFVAFITPIGVQMALAFPIALLFRAAKIPALACTWVTNYFTIPFIYPVQCYIGGIIIGAPLSLKYIEETFGQFFEDPTVNGFYDMAGEILFSFVVGGAVFGTIAAFIGYFASYGMVVRYRQRVDAKLRKRLASAPDRIDE